MDISRGDCKQVVTRASLILQQKGLSPEYQALTVNAKVDNTAQAKNENVFLNKKPTENKDEDDFDMKKARNEVLNFAMARQRVTKNQTKMQIFQAIKLGAKPMKKACKNYKDLQGERKRLKDIREQRLKSNQLGKYQASLASAKHQRRVNKNKQNNQEKQRLPYKDIDKHYGSVHQPAKKQKQQTFKKKIIK